ncbi:MAG TPA: DUF1844 domain-containing protein [Thermosulfurimonas dismutans]|uniref:DUF1844 domain-containing protein n=1 Tax=Thermosulfurimonas dismutans TaxID=999894 RepID=A0A7C3GS31_9BACT|nr:DUF1844 domain-containing protein [Thermosulfurimonas sp.]HFC97242.1 DUF1844 domain-containing protein [Thermosulfurimonas dismutans]
MGDGEKREKQAIPLPPVTFSTFILSLNTAALIHLGELPNPDTNEKTVNLTLARHTIDTLDMLREKTRGNLTPDEERLLESILYELRLRYVKLTS